ncbi:MAG: hypothetical protein V3T77_02225, partial [Planctomycetota bacterium]
MARLSSVIQLFRLSSWLRLRPILYFVGVAVLVVVLETVGRNSPNDRWDILGVMALLFAIRISAVIPGEFVPWRSALRRRLRTFLEKLGSTCKHRVGIDLRGDATGAPQGVPLFRRITLLGWLVLSICVALHSSLPEGLRSTLLMGSTTLYFLIVGTLWTLLGIGIAVSLVVCYMLAHDFAIRSQARTRSQKRRRTLLISGGYFLLALSAAWFCPVQIGLAIAVLPLLLVHFYPRRPEGKSLIALVRNQLGDVYSIPFTSFVRQANTWVCLGVLILGLLASGAKESVSSETVITHTLGTGFLWFTAPLLCGVLVRGLFLFWGQPRLHSPGAPRQKTAYLMETDLGAWQGQTPTALTEKILAEHGWSLTRGPAPPRRDAADLWLRPKERPREKSESRPGPLPAGPPIVELDAAEMEDCAVARRLDRQDHIWKRRRLFRALRRLFKSAASQRYDSGSGYIFAPHYWFVPGFARDEDEDELNFHDSSDGTIGPSYHHLLGVRLRRYLREVFDSVEIDLIYIEDGVGYRGLKRVLAVLFEVYDMHDGKVRLEEHH